MEQSQDIRLHVAIILIMIIVTAIYIRYDRKRGNRLSDIENRFKKEYLKLLKEILTARNSNSLLQTEKEVAKFHADYHEIIPALQFEHKYGMLCIHLKRVKEFYSQTPKKQANP
ncbi:MAG: hypothetical protein QM802_20020 [Agriterribacter sp.]